jgi:hypothetical protein
MASSTDCASPRTASCKQHRAIYFNEVLKPCSWLVCRLTVKLVVVAVEWRPMRTVSDAAMLLSRHSMHCTTAGVTARHVEPEQAARCAWLNVLWLCYEGCNSNTILDACNEQLQTHCFNVRYDVCWGGVRPPGVKRWILCRSLCCCSCCTVRYIGQ